jgi:hypothetical protein
MNRFLATALGVSMAAGLSQVAVAADSTLLLLQNRQENSTQINPGSKVLAETDAQGELTAVLYGGVDDPVAKLEKFTLQELNSSTGAIFEANHSALVLFGQKVDSKAGGSVDLRHIYNGVFGTYHHCAAELHKDPHGKWAFYSPAGQVISQATLVVYSIGIRTIEGFDCH